MTVSNAMKTNILIKKEAESFYSHASDRTDYLLPHLQPEKIIHIFK